MRVVEGWHPSDPETVGYNLLVDDDWFGTFASLEDAATAAAVQVDEDGEVVLRPYPDRSGARLRLVEPSPDDD